MQSSSAQYFSSLTSNKSPSCQRLGKGREHARQLGIAKHTFQTSDITSLDIKHSKAQSCHRKFTAIHISSSKTPYGGSDGGEISVGTLPVNKTQGLHLQWLVEFRRTNSSVLKSHGLPTNQTTNLKH